MQSIPTSTNSAYPLIKREWSLQGAEGTELSAGWSVGKEDAHVLHGSLDPLKKTERKQWEFHGGVIIKQK